MIPGCCLTPCEARGSRCETEYDCWVLLGEERSASEMGGCAFANDSFKDLGMVKLRTVMVKPRFSQVEVGDTSEEIDKSFKALL